MGKFLINISYNLVKYKKKQNLLAFLTAYSSESFVSVDLKLCNEIIEIGKASDTDLKSFKLKFYKKESNSEHSFI